jgi:hypothetical protein
LVKRVSNKIGLSRFVFFSVRQYGRASSPKIAHFLLKTTRKIRHNSANNARFARKIKRFGLSTIDDAVGELRVTLNFCPSPLVGTDRGLASDDLLNGLTEQTRPKMRRLCSEAFIQPWCTHPQPSGTARRFDFLPGSP